jgi:hypothetical protein
MGSSGGSTPSNTTSSTTTQVAVPGWVQSQLQQNLGTANALAAQPYTAPNLPTVAGFSPDQLAAFQAVQNNLGSTNQAYSLAGSQLQNLPQSTQSLLNPYLGSVEADTVSNIQRASAQQGQVNEANAVASGAYGGTRDAVQESQLASETQRNIGQAINTIQSQGYTTAQQAALAQAAAEGNIATAGQAAELQGASALNQVGQQQQTLQQAQYASALQQWQAAQNYPYQQLALQQSALAGSPYGNTVTSSQPYTSNEAEQLLGLGISAAPLAITAANYLTAPAAATPMALTAGTTAADASVGGVTASSLLAAPAETGTAAGSIIGAGSDAAASAGAADAAAAGSAAGKSAGDVAATAAPALAA